MVCETSCNFFTIVLFLLFFFFDLFRDLDIFFHLLGNDNFCSLFDLFLPFFIFGSFELLDWLVFLLFPSLHFPLGVLWLQILTICDQTLTYFNFFVMGVAINKVFFLLFHLLFSLFVLFFSFFFALGSFLSFFLPVFELLLFLLFDVLPFFFASLFLLFSEFDLLFFFGDHLDETDEIEIILVVVESIEIFVFRFFDFGFRIFDLFLDSFDFLIKFCSNLFGSLVFGCIDVLFSHLLFYLLQILSSIFIGFVFLIDLFSDIFEFVIQNLAFIFESTSFSSHLDFRSKLK